MRFFAKNRASTDRSNIVKDDSLVRNVGSGQIEQTNVAPTLVVDGSSVISTPNGSTRCIERLVEDFSNGRIRNDRPVTEKNNSSYDRLLLVDYVEKERRHAERYHEQEDQIAPDNFEERTYRVEEDVANDEIRHFWECTSSIRSTSSFEYMRILLVNPWCH